MAVQPILRIGDPRLLVEALVVTAFDEQLQQLLTDMTDTMQQNEGIGIAAPQIGVNKRVIIYGMENNARYPDLSPLPLTILVNPECLSIMGVSCTSIAFSIDALMR